MPVDRGAIDAQLREIGEGERWWEQREFRDLPYILFAEERIRGIAYGKLLGRRRPRLKPAGRWLIVVTDERILCLKQERFARRQIEVPAREIRSIRQSSGFRSHQVVVTTARRRYRLRIANDDAFRFSGALAPLVSEPERGSPLHEPEPWAWIPGMSTVARITGVSAVFSNVPMLAGAVDYATRADVERLAGMVDRLNADVERLQQEVAFLEDLLQKRAEQARVASRAGTA